MKEPFEQVVTWYPYPDHKPTDESKFYWVWYDSTDGQFYETDWYEYGRFTHLEDDEIIAWAELPEGRK